MANTQRDGQLRWVDFSSRFNVPGYFTCLPHLVIRQPGSILIGSPPHSVATVLKRLGTGG